jgi:hypothetical protein
MIDPLTFDDVTFTKKRIQQLRVDLVKLRDECLKQGAIHEAFVLSVSHALLLHLEENTNDESGNGS